MARTRALSCGHLEQPGANGIAAMAEAGSAVLLPGACCGLRERRPPPETASRAAAVPTSTGREDRVAMATQGARRPRGMTADAAGLVASELPAARRGLAFHPLMAPSPAPGWVGRAVRARVAHLDKDRIMAPNIDAATEFVDNGTLRGSVGHRLLPEIDP